MDINVLNVIETVIVQDLIDIAQEVVVTPVQVIVHQTVHAPGDRVVEETDVRMDEMTKIL